MLSLTKSAIVMLVAPIGQSEPWELTPFGGKVRCTPTFGDVDERGSALTEHPVLLLSDWGFLDHEDAHRARDAPEIRVTGTNSPAMSKSDIVLLVSTAVIPLFASLRARAVEGDHGDEDPLRRDDWCAVWPHFVTANESVHTLLRDVVAQHTCGRGLVPSARPRRYVYGSLPGDVSPLPLVRPTAPRVDTARCRVPDDEPAELAGASADLRRRRDEPQYASWTPTVFLSNGAPLVRDAVSTRDEDAR